MSRRRNRLVSLVAAVTLCVLAPILAQALTICNAAGCYNAIVTNVKIDSGGKIWMVTDNDTELLNLDKPGGCVVKQVWTSGAKYGLYIPTSDPEREEKYTMLLLAYTTGVSAGFSIDRDPATGWCYLAAINVN